MKLTLVELGTELMEDGNQGIKIQLARELSVRMEKRIDCL